LNEEQFAPFTFQGCETERPIVERECQLGEIKRHIGLAPDYWVAIDFLYLFLVVVVWGFFFVFFYYRFAFIL
jgi:hypothetical protein